MKEFKSTYLKLITIIVLTSILGCTVTSNKEIYNVKIGETFKIYYSTNSCCYYCLNEKEIKSVTLLENMVVEEGPKDCEGCNSKYAFLFKGIETGIDTIKLSLTTSSTDCSEASRYYEKYIVQVTK
jgi:hypothetical protein